MRYDVDGDGDGDGDGDAVCRQQCESAHHISLSSTNCTSHPATWYYDVIEK